jgi:hypothetical protein
MIKEIYSGSDGTLPSSVFPGFLTLSLDVMHILVKKDKNSLIHILEHQHFQAHLPHM